MSLPYFPLYPKDYEAKTSHLSMVEDGAYNRLLRLCWMTPGCSLPDDEAWIMRRARAHTEEEKEAVRVVLAEFFTKDKGRVRQPRLSEEAMLAETAHKKRVDAGRKGGRKPKSLKTNETGQSNAKAMPKQPEPEPDILPDTNVSGAKPPSIFDIGIAALVRRGVTEKNARSLTGKWRKDYGEDATLSLFRQIEKYDPSDPVEYAKGILRKRSENVEGGAFGRIPERN